MIYSEHRQNFRACGGQSAGQRDYPPLYRAHPSPPKSGREYPGGLVLRLVCEVLVSVSCVSRLPPVSLNRYVLPVLPDTHDLIRANASLAAVRDREA